MPSGVYVRTRKNRKAISKATRLQWKRGDHDGRSEQMKAFWKKNRKWLAPKVSKAVRKRLLLDWQDPDYRERGLRHLANICRLGGVNACLSLRNNFYRSSRPQERLRARLANVGIDSIPNYRMDFACNFHKIIDIAIPSRRIAIEVDGRYWHSSKEARKKDCEKNFLLWNSGWTLIRVDAAEVENGRVLERIMRKVFRS